MARNPLAIEFAGIPFQNPFLLSSGPPTMDASRIIRAAKLGWGGAVTKTINKDGTVDPRVRLGALRRDGQLIGMNNIELLSRAPLKTWTDDWIPAIKAAAPEGFVLVASLFLAYVLDPPVSLLSRIPLGSPIYCTPVAANGVLYVASQRYLWAVQAQP